MILLQRARIAASAALGFPRSMRLPLVGDMDGRFRSPGARIDDPRFGRSEGLPFTLEVVVDGERSAPAGVAREVDRVFFRDRGKLLFNVSFACGKPQGLFRRGLYGDPRSHWFNVFFGCYQIDVPKRVWGRPFGYREDGRTIDRDEVLRIGKSDWNYFSNWMYGVPDAAITPTDGLDDPQLRFEQRPRRAVNGRAWDEVLLDGVRVASAYDPGRADGLQLVDRGLWSALWRASFGLPLRRAVVDEPAFFAVPMAARLYMAFRESAADDDLGEPSYQTFFFGGTVNRWYAEHAADAAERDRRRVFNEAFLEAQMRAVERVMRDPCGGLGFPSP